VTLLRIWAQYPDYSKNCQGTTESAGEHAAAAGEEIRLQKEGNREDDRKTEAFYLIQPLQK
jgi:hypothetical protein